MSNVIDFSTGEILLDDTLAKHMKDRILSSVIENIVELGIDTNNVEFQANLLLVSLALDVLISKAMGMSPTLLSDVK